MFLIYLSVILVIYLNSKGFSFSISPHRSRSLICNLSPIADHVLNSDSYGKDATPHHPSPSKSFFIETHGCQMNLADSDIVRSVLLTVGYKACDVLEDADLILTNTCAIRENAESKIWQRLKYFQSLRKKAKLNSSKPSGYPIIGVLGCMAERLKEDLLKDTGVDFIAGPDAYRTLPVLVESVLTTDQKACNTQLSLEETYADIPPVRLAEGNTHAFVTITRGCDNHCAFCVVPYTRGKERSLPVESIVNQVRLLSQQGIKEVVLLGQNVNSYHDVTTPARYYHTHSISQSDPPHEVRDTYSMAPGFSERKRSIPRHLRKPRKVVIRSNDETVQTVEVEISPVITGNYETSPLIKTGTETADIASNDMTSNTKKQTMGPGSRFGELLLRVAEVDPDMRIRFQSPHPKDFPDDLLTLIAETPNICNSLHMPAQHGSSIVLDRMRRGYTRQAYDSLVQRARDIIGGVEGSAGLGLSTDMIAGFCGETEDDHEASLSLLRNTGYDQAFTYAYSRREQTFAGLFLQDDVPEEVKSRRLQELVDTFQSTAVSRNKEIEIGRFHLVLVEGYGKKSTPENPTWTGRTDTNKRVVFPSSGTIPESLSINDMVLLMSKNPIYSSLVQHKLKSNDTKDLMSERDNNSASMVGEISKGKYVVVQITDARGHTLRGIPIGLSSICDWWDIMPSSIIMS